MNSVIFSFLFNKYVLIIAIIIFIVVNYLLNQGGRDTRTELASPCEKLGWDYSQPMNIDGETKFKCCKKIDRQEICDNKLY